MKKQGAEHQLRALSFLRSLLVFVALAVHGAVRAVRAAGGLSGLLLSQQIHDNEGHNDS